MHNNVMSQIGRPPAMPPMQGLQAPERMPEIVCEFDKLRAAAESVCKMADELGLRLARLTRPDNGQEMALKEPQKETAPATIMAQDLASVRGLMHATQDRLTFILGNLEI